MKPHLRKEAQLRALYKVTTRYFNKEATDFVQNNFPALSAAFDSYSAVREQEKQMELAKQFASYPGLMSQQPAMREMAMTGGSLSAPPVHHRRHRHHHLG